MRTFDNIKPFGNIMPPLTYHQVSSGEIRKGMDLYIIKNPCVHLVFWGKQWMPDSAIVNKAINDFDRTISRHYLWGLEQYGIGNGIIKECTFLKSDPESIEITPKTVHTIIDYLYNNDFLSSSDLIDNNTILMFIVGDEYQLKISSYTPTYSGYHGNHVMKESNYRISYGIHHLNTVTFTHELIETSIAPKSDLSSIHNQVTSYYLTFFETLANGYNECEICDIYTSPDLDPGPDNLESITLDPGDSSGQLLSVAPYWSVRDNSFIIPDFGYTRLPLGSNREIVVDLQINIIDTSFIGKDDTGLFSYKHLFILNPVLKRGKLRVVTPKVWDNTCTLDIDLSYNDEGSITARWKLYLNEMEGGEIVDSEYLSGEKIIAVNKTESWIENIEDTSFIGKGDSMECGFKISNIERTTLDLSILNRINYSLVNQIKYLETIEISHQHQLPVHECLPQGSVITQWILTKSTEITISPVKAIYGQSIYPDSNTTYGLIHKISGINNYIEWYIDNMKLSKKKGAIEIKNKETTVIDFSPYDNEYFTKTQLSTISIDYFVIEHFNFTSGIWEHELKLFSTKNICNFSVAITMNVVVSENAKVSVINEKIFFENQIFDGDLNWKKYWECHKEKIQAKAKTINLIDSFLSNYIHHRPGDELLKLSDNQIIDLVSDTLNSYIKEIDLINKISQINRF